MSRPPTREGIALRKKQQPQEVPKDVDRGWWVHCPYCGKGVMIAFGYNGYGITRQKQMKALLGLGWEVAPRYRCNVCIKFGNRTLHET